MAIRGCSSWGVWFQGANFAIYSCHFLASWSGRMWGFAIGLFLISISPGSLQLSATYGLTMGAGVLLLGSIIGDWVDRTARLKAALASMILQNVFVVSCACVMLALLFLLSEIKDLNQGLKKFFYALVITLSVTSRLLKVARIIVVERDWIIEISRQNKTDLSVMTSTFRRIDLLTKICAPIFTGQIMTYAGLKISCGVISVWSLVSMGVEYLLIRRVYNIVPALHAVKDTMGAITLESVPNKSETWSGRQHKSESQAMNKDKKQKPADVTIRPGVKRGRKPFSPLRFFDSFIILFRGFRTYMKYKVRWAGFALASLYLTVLGFDGITVGYATTQGMTGSILGIMMGVGAAFGILATFTYPCIVRRLGLAKTGVLALSLQLSCLSLCVISVWLPGSPFDPGKDPESSGHIRNSSLRNCSHGTTNRTLDHPSVTETIRTSALPVIVANASQSHCQEHVFEESRSMVSVWVMLVGIVTARFGLWTADLAIIQLFLERVAASERGIVNGFQSSLNQLMDFLKYALVAAIPLPHQFALLIFISFFFICTGWTWMLVFALRTTNRPL